MIQVVAPTLNTLPIAQDQQNPTFARESIPTTPIGDASPLALDYSLTPKWYLAEELDIRVVFETKDKSSTAKANRSVNRGALTYCGGSISTAVHFEKQSKEFQGPPTAWEMMEKTMKLKSGE
ncbi:hypothetical protein HKD37_13G035631 [Glycine soja]